MQLTFLRMILLRFSWEPNDLLWVLRTTQRTDGRNWNVAEAFDSQDMSCNVSPPAFLDSEGGEEEHDTRENRSILKESTTLKEIAAQYLTATHGHHPPLPPTLLDTHSRSTIPRIYGRILYSLGQYLTATHITRHHRNESYAALHDFTPPNLCTVTSTGARNMSDTWRLRITIRVILCNMSHQ